MTPKRALRLVCLAIAVLAFLFLAWTGIRGGLQVDDAVSLGQQVQTGSQVLYGVFSLVVPFATLKRYRWAGPASIVWVLAVTLAPPVWGGTGLGPRAPGRRNGTGHRARDARASPLGRLRALTKSSLAGCDLSHVTVCTDEIRIRLGPADTSLVVGQSFRATVSLTTCGGDRSLGDVFSWSSEDPAVAAVDRDSGRVTGLAPGTTRIQVTGRQYGWLGQLGVVVLPAPS